MHIEVILLYEAKWVQRNHAVYLTLSDRVDDDSVATQISVGGGDTGDGIPDDCVLIYVGCVGELRELRSLVVGV